MAATDPSFATGRICAVNFAGMLYTTANISLSYAPTAKRNSRCARFDIGQHPLLVAGWRASGHLYQNRDWHEFVDSGEREHRAQRKHAGQRLDGPAGQEIEGKAWVDKIRRGVTGGRGVGVRDVPNKLAANVERLRDGTLTVRRKVHLILADAVATSVVGAGAWGTHFRVNREAR